MVTDPNRPGSQDHARDAAVHGGGRIAVHARIGFTLVELLIVISIILVLSALVLTVGVPAITSMVDRSVMQRRAEQVVAGLAQYQGTDGVDNALAVINCAGNTNLRFASLRQVLKRLINAPPAGFGLDLPNATRANLPPNLGTMYIAEKAAKLANPTNDINKMVYPITGYFVTGTALDDVITFRNRMISVTSDVFPGTGGIPENVISAGDCLIADHYAGVVKHPDPKPGFTSTFGLRHPVRTRIGENVYPVWNARKSPLGETLDGTLEVMPDMVWPTANYYARWPNLIQTWSTVAGVKRAINSSWSVSDWPSGGSIPVVWPFPWGGKVLGRQDSIVAIDQVEGLVAQGDVSDPGNPSPWLDPNDSSGSTVVRLDSAGRLSTDYLSKARSADCLSPLASIRLLTMAGILEKGSAGEDAYRKDRKTNKAWNDRWGQPLLVGFAAFIAPRYDFDDVNDLYNYAHTCASGDKVNGRFPRTSDKMHGGRDVIMKTIRRDIGSGWLGYLCIGSTGPSVGGVDFGSTWNDANDDRVQLLERWKAITTACAAWEWHQFSFGAPPGSWRRADPDGGTWSVDAWSKSGMRKGVRGNRQTCFLSSPLEVK